MASVYEREFEFKKTDFEFIRELVGERTGIVLSDHKIDMVYGRLSRRLRVRWAILPNQLLNAISA